MSFLLTFFFLTTAIEKIEAGDCLPSKSSSRSLYTKMIFSNSQGKQHTLASWQKGRKKPLMIVMWAPWCGPCIGEMPSIEKLYHKLKGKVDILPISIEAPGKEGLCVSGVHSLPLYYSETLNTFATHLGIKEIPAILFFNQEGKLVEKEIGARNWDSASSITYIKSILGISSKP